ncbi:hypothetical protein AB1046_17670 [Promicromonospora sp. Populi]|uniref:hypothetical protein n=1 Tax=Promicromonospora sp. Populi TaxID=3239420 RepID=UPI0034E1A0DB
MATLDEVYDEPRPYVVMEDSRMWAASQGSGWAAEWTSEAGVQVGVIVRGLDPEHNGMDLWSLAGELAGRD